MESTTRDHDALLQAYNRRRELVDDHLEAFLARDDPTELNVAASHLFNAGGKRLRPVTALLAADAIVGQDLPDIDYRAVPATDGEPVDILQAAFALEVLHTFTLVHDDIMDDDPLRRGEPAVHTEYGDDLAILSGDYLYALAYDLLLESGATPERVQDAVRLVTDTMLDLCQGQARDIDFEGRDDVTLDEYVDMIRGKTAVLYGASAALSGIVLGASSETIDALYEFGLNAGLGFQIYDDVLDLTVDTEQLGKERGSDLVEQKRTVVTLHAQQHGVAVDALVPDDPTDADIVAAVETLEQAGSIEYAETQAREYITAAQAELYALPASPARDRLAGLASYLIERSH